MYRTILLAFAWSSVVWMAGCGNSGSADDPETVSVSGTVFMDDKPLANAQVNFVTDNFSATGVTGSDGTYQLAQGAVPGENQVSITMWEGESSIGYEPDEGIDEGQFEAAAEGDINPGKLGSAVASSAAGMARQSIPSRYNTASTLTFNVPEGGTDNADFRLASDK